MIKYGTDINGMKNKINKFNKENIAKIKKFFLSFGMLVTVERRADDKIGEYRVFYNGILSMRIVCGWGGLCAIEDDGMRLISTDTCFVGFLLNHIKKLKERIEMPKNTKSKSKSSKIATIYRLPDGQFLHRTHRNLGYKLSKTMDEAKKQLYCVVASGTHIEIKDLRPEFFGSFFQ